MYKSIFLENKMRVKRDNQILLSKLLDISAGKNVSINQIIACV